MQPMPLRPQKFTHGVADRQTDSDAEGLQPLNGRRAQVLWLADTQGHILSQECRTEEERLLMIFWLCSTTARLLRSVLDWG
jgi:hypothetical protein